MSSDFRMSLSLRLNFYVFQLVHAAKNLRKMFIINKMMAGLIAKEKRTDYEENNEDSKTRSVKNAKNGKSPNNYQPANEKRKKPKSCSYCKGLCHTEKQCYYLHPELKKEE